MLTGKDVTGGQGAGSGKRGGSGSSGGGSGSGPSGGGGGQKKNATCSFCRKSFRDVGPLVEGPSDVYICGERIELC